MAHDSRLPSQPRRARLRGRASLPIVIGLVLLSLGALWTVALWTTSSGASTPTPISINEVELPLVDPERQSDVEGIASPSTDPLDLNQSPRRAEPEGQVDSSATDVLARFQVIGLEDDQSLATLRVHAGPEHLVGKSALGDIESSLPFQSDPVSIALDKLPSLSTDSQGLLELRVAMPSRGLPSPTGLVAAVSIGGLEAWVNPTLKQVRGAGGRPFPLKLRPRQEWTLRAVDASGRGRSDVRVQAQLLRAQDLDAIARKGALGEFPFMTEDRAPWTQVLGTTGAQGRLSFAGAPLMETEGNNGAPDSAVAVLFAAMLPQADAVPVLIRDLPEAGTVIDLPMQPSAQGSVRLTDHQGVPLSGWHFLQAIHRADGGPVALRTVLISDGLGQLGPLPVATALRLQVGDRDELGIDVVSPQNDGEPLGVELRAGPNHAVLVGQLLDADGRPVVDRPIEASGAGWRALCYGTNRNGRFSALVPLDQDQGQPQAVILRVRDDLDEPDRARMEYRERLNAPLSATTFALGALSPAGPRPLLVAGRVVRPLDSVCHDYRLHVEAQGPRGAWRELHGCIASRSGDGSFSIHGDPEPSAPHRLIVRMSGECHLRPEPVTFEPGRQDLSVELDPGGAVTLRVASPITVGSAKSLERVLDFTLEGVAGSAAEIPGHRLEVSRYGNVDSEGLTSLHWSGLPPGAYRLQVLAKGTETVLATLPDIAVSSQQESSPPLLDLNGAVHRFHLDIVGPDDGPLQHARVSMRWDSSATGGTISLQSTSGEGIAPRIPVEVLATASGYISQRQPLAEGVQKISMEPVRLTASQIQVAGLEIPSDVHASLAWGPPSLVRDFGQESAFAVDAETQRARDELRIGREALGSNRTLTIEQPTDPGAENRLRMILILTAPPLPGRSEIPSRQVLDEMPGWVIPNPPPLSTTLRVDKASLQRALQTMGRS